MSVNKVILVGRLGQNPELKSTPSGASVTNFTLATNETWMDKGGQRQERVEWHRIVVWGKMAEVCSRYLSKGRQVYVEGALQTRTWDDANGQKRYTTEIRANTVQFLGAGASEGTRPANTAPAPNGFQEDTGFSPPPAASGADSAPSSSFTEDDIPF